MTPKKDRKKRSKRSTNMKKVFSVLFILMFIMQIILSLGFQANAASSDSSELDSTTEIQTFKSEDSTNLESEDTEEIDSSKDSSSEVIEEEVPEEVKKPDKKEETVKEPSKPVKKEQTDTSKDSSIDSSKDTSKEEKTEEKKDQSTDSSEEKNEEESEETEFEDDLLKPGRMLDNLLPYVHPTPTPLLRFKPIARRNSGPKFEAMSVDPGGLAPGEVKTSKTAKRVPGMVNTWDITVQVMGRDTEEHYETDIVLVLDRSGSMLEIIPGQTNTQMKNVQLAAENFIDQTIGYDPNIQIAIVSYSSDFTGQGQTSSLYTINQTFTKNVGTLKAAINSLRAHGGTHTQAGLMQGRQLFNHSTANPNADFRHMILLSDGEPTFSYQPTNWTNGRPSWGTDGGLGNNRQRTAVYNGSFNESVVVGTGNDVRQSYTVGGGTGYRYHIDNGLAAIKAGEDARSGITKLHTIGILLQADAFSILRRIASTPSDAYNAMTPQQLPGLFENIRQSITTNHAIANAVITDEMGDGFTLIDSSLNKTSGTTNIAQSTSSKNKTITWNIPQVNNLVEGRPDVRFAEMTYRVEINPDILTAPVATSGATAEHNLFKTNKATQMSYKDVHGATPTINIASPEVDPVLLKIKKNLLDENGNVIENDDRRFNTQITNGTNFNHTQNLVPNADYVTLTTLRYEGTYTVTETGITGPGNTALNGFNVSYEINGNEQNTFLVNHQGNIPRGDVIIDVTNEAIPQTIDFSFTKVDEEGNPLLGAEFTLEGEDDNGESVFIENTDTDPLFAFNGLTEGTYVLTETKAPQGYKLPTSPWEITVVRNADTGQLEIIIPDDSFLTNDPEDGHQVGNEEQSEFPQTGGIGMITYLGVGLTFIMTSVGMYLKKDDEI